jgi:hypothetical protein
MTVRKVCGYAKNYKGIQKPTCGCDYCMSVWDSKQLFGVHKIEAPTGEIFTIKLRV